MNRFDNRALLLSVQCPKLVIVGREDTLAPPEETAAGIREFVSGNIRTRSGEAPARSDCGERKPPHRECRLFAAPGVSPRRFSIEQFAFALQAPGVARKRSFVPHHPVTRDRDC
jgi:hypothetical protein